MQVEDIERLKEQQSTNQQHMIERENETLVKLLNNRIKLASITPSTRVNNLIKQLIDTLKQAGY